MNKILIDTTALRELLARQPEMEVELTRYAAEKVAEQIATKIGRSEKAISDAVDRAIRQTWGSCAPLSPGAKAAVVEVASSVIGEAAKDAAIAVAKAATEEALTGVKEAAEVVVANYVAHVLDAQVRRLVEHHFNALVTAAAQLNTAPSNATSHDAGPARA